MTVKIVRNIISIMLIFTILVSGWSVFSPEDQNLDNCVDLKDALMMVKKFDRKMLNPAVFYPNLKKLISTLRVVAGLNTVIKAEKQVQSAGSLDSYFMVLAISFYYGSNMSSEIENYSVMFESNVVYPECHPPQC
ncbi:hypothetical protein QUF76_09955 [Desulfobacterales bacterium HSG16]|nr:hypothetical protein [Desulfobacterales bacterium HSG16]